MIQTAAPWGAAGLGPRRRDVGWGGRERLGFGGELREAEEMALVRVIDPALAARSEEVAAEQGQGLGQLGVLLLQAVVVGGGLLEDALQLVDAAEQVVEEPPAFDRIIGESRRDAQEMNYTR